ncbi:MAG: MASE1 domain-containing protein [Alphaproteobacteria bacterium]|nr:MASE1 domain-containing protein [Alphaproteobacteria bacterium]
MTRRIFGLPDWAIGLAFLVGYVALDWISYIDPFAPYGITPWNPPPGLGFVLVLLFGQRFLPLLFIGPLLADLLVRRLPLPWSVELLAVVVIGGGYALGIRSLLRPSLRFDPALASMRDLVWLLFVAGATAAFVAVSYAAVLSAFGILSVADFAAAALTFWVGDVIGIAVVAPAALVFLTRLRPPRPKPETAAQIVAILVALALVFVFAERHHFQLFYILFLPIIWMAVRGGLETVTVGIVLTQVGLMIGVQFLPIDDVSVTAFQALMLVLTLTGLVAGALVNEHRSTEFQLRLHQESLARLARLGSMGELAAAVAHEINQPLTAAGTYARLVADGLADRPGHDPLLAETARKAASQVARAADVVRRLRALIRLDQTGRAPTEVRHLVEETLDLCRPTLERHNVAVHVSLADGLPAVMADLLQIEQVILNLLRNAVEAIDQAGHASGTIRVEAVRTENGEVEIRIVDSGPGFPPQFGGGSPPPLSSAKADGLGVGLSLCRSIVESHGGRILLGGGPRGAQVRFTLPIAKAVHG